MPYRAWAEAAEHALAPLADPGAAQQMAAYMKHVAPFLGIQTKPRRAALKSAWRGLAPLDQSGLTALVQDLWRRREREYQYAACEALDWHRGELSAGFLSVSVRALVVTKPWWDTVDSLGSAIIAPLVRTHPELVDTMWAWNRDEDRWLVRASIQHQRGNGAATDLSLLLALCTPHISDREFFIAKAIGWALRDASAHWPNEVQAYIDEHPGISSVARREGQRGVDRALAAVAAQDH
ncbi:MAG: DNA alkylation repair protein [Candidatus Nanopelagicales bacterium]|nr:DNA alkylation repair protein [Candidatus Nanopelagicales bacterium]